MNLSNTFIHPVVVEQLEKIAKVIDTDLTKITHLSQSTGYICADVVNKFRIGLLDEANNISIREDINKNCTTYKISWFGNMHSCHKNVGEVRVYHYPNEAPTITIIGDLSLEYLF